MQGIYKEKWFDSFESIKKAYSKEQSITPAENKGKKS